jgi:hypothetical protein
MSPTFRHTVIDLDVGGFLSTSRGPFKSELQNFSFDAPVLSSLSQSTPFPLVLSSSQHAFIDVRIGSPRGRTIATVPITPTAPQEFADFVASIQDTNQWFLVRLALRSPIQEALCSVLVAKPPPSALLILSSRAPPRSAWRFAAPSRNTLQRT